MDTPKDRTVIAVLDGQQRLTALNIGLRGSFASRVKGGWWSSAKSFPRRRLFVNVFGQAPENEQRERCARRPRRVHGRRGKGRDRFPARLSFADRDPAPARLPHGLRDHVLGVGVVADLRRNGCDRFLVAVKRVEAVDATVVEPVREHLLGTGGRRVRRGGPEGEERECAREQSECAGERTTGRRLHVEHTQARGCGVTLLGR